VTKCAGIAEYNYELKACELFRIDATANIK